MTAELVTLAIIALLAFICPIICELIPGNFISETVLLLVTGMLVGPYVLNIVDVDGAISLLNDLGLGFLFLLAGYEIDPKILTGHQGKRGLITWLFTFVLAFLVVLAWPAFAARSLEGLAVTIALTTTAIGTLLPILQERGVLATEIGQSILSYGTWGELCPVLAITLLLSTRAEWVTVVVLASFLLIAVLAGVLPKRARTAGSYVFRFITANAETNSQMIVRAAVLLLVGLTAISAVFDLDIVLGAFAAGFILRYVIPEGNDAMENKLHAIAFGFFIPLFFIYSGTQIDVGAVAENPTLLIVFIVLLLFVRALPIYVSLSTDKQTRSMSSRSRLTVAIYCTTALPLIVAVTTVAIQAEAMTQATGSVLVAAGGITVLIMPIVGQLLLRTADAEPITLAKKIAAEPKKAGAHFHSHRVMEAMRHEADRERQRLMRHEIHQFRIQTDEQVESELGDAPQTVTLTPLDSDSPVEETFTIEPVYVDEDRDALTAALDEQEEIEEAEEKLEDKDT